MGQEPVGFTLGIHHADGFLGGIEDDVVGRGVREARLHEVVRVHVMLQELGYRVSIGTPRTYPEDRDERVVTQLILSSALSQ